MTKKSRYIPKRLVQKVERINQEKAAVREILSVLGAKAWQYCSDKPENLMKSGGVGSVGSVGGDNF